MSPYAGLRAATEGVFSLRQRRAAIRQPPRPAPGNGSKTNSAVEPRGLSKWRGGSVAAQRAVGTVGRERGSEMRGYMTGAVRYARHRHRAGKGGRAVAYEADAWKRQVVDHERGKACSERRLHEGMEEGRGTE